MLRLVLGIAGTGKTTRLLHEIEQRAGERQLCILLVPEQFSSSAEAMVYKALGDEKNAFVEVLSFRTLAERVLKTCGGANLRVMTDAGRAVFVRRALDAVRGELAAFARQKRSAAFCNACAETISELKTAGATPEVLHEVAAHEKDAKLKEIALIWQAYESGIAGAAMDPGDRLVLAAQKADCGFFEGKACFIDNFDGFTAPEYSLLQQVLLRCDAVTVAFCCDALQESDDGLGRFSPVRKTANHLQGLAAQAGCATGAPVVLQQIWRSGKAGIRAVNELLAGRREAAVAAEPGAVPVGPSGDSAAVPDSDTMPALPAVQACEGVTLTNVPDEWAEVRLAAAEMHRLAQDGVPYSRMTLVCRDIAHYEGAVRRQLGLFGIPYFVDAPSTVEYTAPVAFLRAALGLLRGGLTSQPILALLKTGLCGHTESEISALENYVYTWAPKAEDWRRPFEKNPDGLLARMNEAAVAQKEAAERVRSEVVPVLEAFRQEARGGLSAAALSKQLYLLLAHFHADKQCEAAAQLLAQAGEVVYAEDARRAWDVAMGLLDQMALLLGDEVLRAEEYDELFLLLVRATDFGQVPQSLECVTFTSADRMRLADPAYCFVVGLCEGEFPMEVGYSGLLTHTDREKLVERGVEMPGSFENRVLLEEMFFYRALTAAKEGLYLSWPRRRAGEMRAMSAALEPLCAALAPPMLQLAPEALAATPAAAFDRLGHTYRQNTPEAAGLYAALGMAGGRWAAEVLPLLGQVDNSGAFAVQDGTAIRRIVGEEMVLSATRAERYFACRFAYFMERLLGARPRRKAELSPLESGTFVHFVLEQVLREAGEAFKQCNDEQLAEAANRHADAFVAENLPPQGRRMAYLLGQIKRATVELLSFLRDAAANSDFATGALELPIGGGEEGAVPPLALRTADGRMIKVTGKVDRVDVLHKDGKTYLCILDYKTGDKKFSLADVYDGINMQMMIYMDALCKNGDINYPNPVPAGVLYLTGDPRPESGQRGQTAKPVYKMDGLLLEDASVLAALDRSGGNYLPVKYNKDGSPRAGKQLADLEKIRKINRRIERLLVEMAEGVYAGAFPAQPLVSGGGRPCDWCAYRAACRHEDGRNEQVVNTAADPFAAAVGDAAEGVMAEGGVAGG